jgi:hypothetical protein
MRYAWSVVLIALFVGCETRVYQLHLEAVPGGLQRTLTVWREKQGQNANLRFKEEELTRLAPLYAEHPSAAGDLRQTFRGTFADRMPADVGGHGTYRTVVTPIGSGHWYLERFRGTTDPDGEYYDRRAAIDRLVDLVVGWFDLQLKDAAHHAAVRRFLNQEFRQDVRNVAFYVWLAASDDRPDAVMVETRQEPRRLPDKMIAAAEYLVEHEYVASVSTLAVGISNASTPADQLRTLRRLIAAKSGLDAAKADEYFPFLADEATARKSWGEFLRTTPEYATKKKMWKPDPQKPDQVDGPDPLIVLDALTTQAVTLDIFDDRDELRLTLTVPRAPHETNGDFEGAAAPTAGGTVTWHKHLHSRRELPTVCFASWTVANERFQTAHFGKVAVDGDALAKFVEYFGRLNPPHQAEFAAHLKALEQGDALRGRARDFHFTTPADDEAEFLVGKMLDVLYESL